MLYLNAFHNWLINVTLNIAIIVLIDECFSVIFEFTKEYVIPGGIQLFHWALAEQRNMKQFSLVKS